MELLNVEKVRILSIFYCVYLQLKKQQQHIFVSNAVLFVLQLHKRKEILGLADMDVVSLSMLERWSCSLNAF